VVRLKNNLLKKNLNRKLKRKRRRKKLKRNRQKKNRRLLNLYNIVNPVIRRIWYLPLLPYGVLPGKSVLISGR
jgi:hypothetical protein